MALAAQLCPSSIAGVVRLPVASKNARSSGRVSFAFSRYVVRQSALCLSDRRLGTLQNSWRQGRQQSDWVLQSSAEDKSVVSSEETSVATDVNTGSKNLENSTGPPVLTIIAGLLVMAGFLWVAVSLVQWFVGLFFR